MHIKLPQVHIIHGMVKQNVICNIGRTLQPESILAKQKTDSSSMGYMKQISKSQCPMQHGSLLCNVVLHSHHPELQLNAQISYFNQWTLSLLHKPTTNFICTWIFGSSCYFDNWGNSLPTYYTFCISFMTYVLTLF